MLILLHNCVIIGCKNETKNRTGDKMDIKLELLQNDIYDYIRNLFETHTPDTSKLADTAATMALSEIKMVIGNDELSDFDVVEKIVCILEDYNINCGGRHDF